MSNTNFCHRNRPYHFRQVYPTIIQQRVGQRLLIPKFPKRKQKLFIAETNQTVAVKTSPLTYKQISSKSNLNSENFIDLQRNLLQYFDKKPILTEENFNGIFNGFVDAIVTTIIKHASRKRISRRQQIKK